MAGWTFVASGTSKQADVIEKIRAGLEQLRGWDGAGVASVDLEPTKEGWRAEVSGDAGTPIDHGAIVSHLHSVISGPDPKTGSSEFNSPYVARQNFHDPGLAADHLGSGTATVAETVPAGGEPPS